ncbi:MAG: gliding motility-associated C-terminal domain-containing protein [Bacteroidetes bacterium]|nr:gliding motility-associated C-terminal domain-containing protein [Bacteroidota bacterium]
MPLRGLFLLAGAFMALNIVSAQSFFQKEYHAEGSSLVIPYSVAQRPDGNYVVAYLAQEDSIRMQVACMDAAGNVLWNNRIRAHFNGDFASEGIKKTPILATADNGCVMLVSKSLVTTGQGWAIVKLSADGNIQWTRYMAGIGSVDDLLAYSGDRIYIQARYWSFDSRPFMACLDNNGNPIWEFNIQSHLNNIVSTGMRVLPDGRMLLLMTESNSLAQISHIVRLNSNGTLVPLLSLPNLSLMGVDEHPDGRLFFMARTLDSINLKNQIILGSSINGQVQYMKVLDLPLDFYYGGLLVLSAAKDSLTLTFRGSFLESQRYWFRFDLNGNFGSAHYIPSEVVLNNEITPAADDGFAWLSADPQAGGLHSFILAKTDPQGRLGDCPIGEICQLGVRDTFFPTITVATWNTTPVQRINPGMAWQVPRNLTSTDYCKPLPVLDASITATDSIACGSEPFTFGRVEGATGLSLWTFPGASPASFTGPEPPKVFFPGTGQYMVHHVLNQAGCIDTASLNVQVSEIPTLELPADTMLCTGQSFFIDLPYDPALSYKWNDGSTSPSRPIEATGDYTVTVTTAVGCRRSSTISVAAVALPEETVPRDTFFCNQHSITLTLQVAPGWQVDWADGFQEDTRTFSESGTYFVEAVSPDNCLLTDSVTVVEKPVPDVSIQALEPYACGPRRLKTVGEDLLFFNWNTGDTTAEIAVGQSGLFTVVASDGFCEHSGAVPVEILPCPECSVYIPGVFQPDSGHGFQVFTACTIKGFDLKVYDRWGARVYESKNPDEAWNGDFNGKLLQPGVYVYQLRMTLNSGDQDVFFVKSGDISIVR